MSGQPPTWLSLIAAVAQRVRSGGTGIGASAAGQSLALAQLLQRHVDWVGSLVCAGDAVLQVGALHGGASQGVEIAVALAVRARHPLHSACLRKEERRSRGRGRSSLSAFRAQLAVGRRGAVLVLRGAREMDADSENDSALHWNAQLNPSLACVTPTLTPHT